MESTPLTAEERDELLRSLGDYHRMLVQRLLDERDALAARLAEARGIARRLREAIRWSNDIIEETDACAAFDALHWPDPPEEGLGNGRNLG